ncbi:hypothetical protein FBEOM_10300 [Fusarium beomiforme]|uniref:Uncharacterized protein n=1 Tax=Fusarium beomiforme TaxID=44412 RepID=A0A9P5DUG8_9HYPO|nr:hypothetical protein FBEOM_10300 [Fusarium beomiforme]
MEMLGSFSNHGTEQLAESEDTVMPDAPPLDFDDGIDQSGRGRPTTSSAGQGGLYNSSDAVCRGGESIPHGPESPPSVASNRGGHAILWVDAQAGVFYNLSPKELAAFKALCDAWEHQSSADLATMIGAGEYGYIFWKAWEDFLRTAGQNNVRWDIVAF